MAMTAPGGTPAQTNGELPATGSVAPDATLHDGNLQPVTLSSFRGKSVVLNIFPSVDTGVCAQSVRTFNERLAAVEGLVVINVSLDLPFAQKRFCGAEGIERSITLSAFRSSFAEDFGVLLTSSAFEGLTARAVVVLDAEGVVQHAELVPEIGQEPNYDAAFAALG